MKTTNLTILAVVTCLALATAAQAQWSVSTLNNPSLLTFDADTPGVFNYRTGTGGGGGVAENLASQVSPSNPNEWSCLLSVGAAIKQQYTTGYTGAGAGSSTRFGNDGNGVDDYGDTPSWPANDNGIIGNPTMIPRTAAQTGLSSDAFRLSSDNDYAYNSLFLRIQNNTGQTITDWKFTADIYYGELDANNFSNLQFSYAVDDGTNPDAMTFTTFGTAPAITQGAVVTTLAGTLNQTVTTTGVANGGYIVLQFQDTLGGAPGSDILLDNIGVTAVPEPSTYALVGFGLLLPLLRRRR